MAFSFFKKEKATTSPTLSFIGTDVHSHLLPGIDDGAPDLETSVALVRGLSELGYKKLVTTPHILWEMYPNTPTIIGSALASLRNAVREAGIDVELHAAAEYFIDDHFDAHLKTRAPLLTLGGNVVLVEFSMLTAPMELQEVIFEMQMQEYQPVIAHPERYVYLTRRRDFFDDLKHAGCWFQLNLLSLAGHYGSAVQELAEYLLKKEYYDLAGTDLHNARHLEALRRLPSGPLRKLEQSGLLKNQQL